MIKYYPLDRFSNGYLNISISARALLKKNQETSASIPAALKGVYARIIIIPFLTKAAEGCRIVRILKA
jgi:hypothetical protein